MSASSQDSPVDLVIRFTAAIPDSVIRVPLAKLTTPLALKQRIRAEIPSSYASCRLRLISAGKVLPDTTALSKCINMPPPPPRSTHDPPTTTQSSKGKAPASDTVSRVYVHCSLGDALTPTELADESSAAETADEALLSPSHISPTLPPLQTTIPTSSTPAPPRGFDRLLNSGFTPTDVANLRAQFLAIQAHTHTPDTMPVGDHLRALEERWLENDPANAATTGAPGADIGEEGGLEDMLWGNVMGFFWPVAAVCWLMREEGVWTRRMKISVLSGMLANLLFGFLRIAI